MRGVGTAISRAQTTGDTQELTLRLHPASLGQLRVRVAFDQARSELSASFEVTSNQARRVVGDTLAQLRASLEARGVGVDTLDVQVAPRAPIGGDPLGLAIGTPNAEARPEVPGAFVDPDGGGRGHDPYASAHDQPGPEARSERGPGSTDAPFESPDALFPLDAAAERLLASMVSQVPSIITRDPGGAARLVIDAVA